MLKNFQLAVLMAADDGMELLRIPMERALQRRLADLWGEQLERFLKGAHEIPFDAGYSPEAHERFRLNRFDLPGPLNGENSTSIRNLYNLPIDEGYAARIKATVGFAHTPAGVEIVMFQKFSRSHVIAPGRYIFFQNDTFRSADSPGLTLDACLAAVYWPAERKLLFSNFRTTNTFIPLADYYRDASENDIQQILAHGKLAPENPSATAKGATQWMKKRFAMLRDSGVLDTHTVRQILKHAKKYDIKIQVDRTSGTERIVFPKDKTAAKRLLQFLNEELFRGAITERLFETNSKREADQ